MAHRWESLSRRWKAMGAAAALALAALVPLQLANASETGTPDPVTAGFTVDRGDITLRMNPVADSIGKSYFRYMAPDGTTQKGLQTFKSSGRCGYQVIAGNLVDVSGGPGSVGYREADNGYGLGVNNSEGTGSCTQVNSGETLTLNFKHGAGALATNEFLDHATLDMELKYTTTVLTIKLYKGSDLVYTYSRTCTASDCGPDSGGSDNRQVRVPTGSGTVLFDKMTIQAAPEGGTQAAATLEGGSDAGASVSTFHVVTPATPIACGQTISASGGGTNAEVTLVDEPGCVQKGVSVSASSRSIEVLTGGSDTTATFVVKSNAWAPEAQQTPVPATTVYPPAGGEAEVWCLGDFDDTSPTYGASMPPGHTWCRISQETVVAGVDPADASLTPNIAPGTPLMQVSEISLLEGDALRNR